MKRGAWVVAIAVGLACQPAWAARMPIHDAAESSAYGRKFGGMIGRGLLNAVTSFVDIVVNIVNETKAGPPVVGTLTGLAKGAGCSVLRVGSAAVDLTTFWVPGFNGMPVSDSYDNCLDLGMTSASAPMMPEPSTSMSRPASGWETPAIEPSAAQAPAPSETPQTAKQTWKK